MFPSGSFILPAQQHFKHCLYSCDLSHIHISHVCSCFFGFFCILQENTFSDNLMCYCHFFVIISEMYNQFLSENCFLCNLFIFFFISVYQNSMLNLCLNYSLEHRMPVSFNDDVIEELKQKISLPVRESAFVFFHLHPPFRVIKSKQDRVGRKTTILSPVCGQRPSGLYQTGFIERI